MYLNRVTPTSFGNSYPGHKPGFFYAEINLERVYRDSINPDGTGSIRSGITRLHRASNEMTPQSLYSILKDLGLTLDGVRALFTKSIAIPKTSGEGIYVDPDSPSWGWRDITGPIETRGVGVTDPDWAQIASSVMSAFKFSLNDTCWIPFHIPHDYVPGTDVHIHTHWLSDGTDVVNTVKWQYEYMYAQGHDQAAFPIASLPAPVTSEQASSAQYQHMVSETAAITIPNLEVDGILYVKMTRIANGATDNTDEIFVLTADVHYQSNNMATKSRAPDFYT